MLKATRVLAVSFIAIALRAAPPYVPQRNAWQHHAPQTEGLNDSALREAVAFAQASESKLPRDLREENDLTFGK